MLLLGTGELDPSLLFSVSNVLSNTIAMQEDAHAALDGFSQ